MNEYVSYVLLGVSVVNLGVLIALFIVVLRHFGPRTAHANLSEFVDEGIALAEQASRLSAKSGGGKLTALDKRREAVAHAANRAKLARVQTTDAELAKLVEIRLAKSVGVAGPAPAPEQPAPVA